MNIPPRIGLGRGALGGSLGGMPPELGEHAPRRASLGSQPVQDRWVCPNDRHLALRAK